MTIILWHQEVCGIISGSLWNYYRDEINDDANENVNNRINNKTKASKYFEYKTKLIGSTPNNDNDILDA